MMAYAKAASVASLGEILALCTVANEQNLSNSACIQPEQIVSSLRLPFPGETTNAELNSLLPLYTKLLKDLQDTETSSSFLDILRNSTRNLPDAAIILLYFLEFPNLVRTLRLSVSDINECNVQETFNCTDLCEEITKTANIIEWCRGALSSSGEHHSVVLASCINILDSINRLPRQKAKKYIKKNVFSVRKSVSRAELIEGFQLLRSDLAVVATREDLTKDASANAILFQMHLLVNLFSEDDAIEIMKSSPRKVDFEKGLSMHRDSFSEEQYQMFRTLLASDDQSFGELVAGSQVARSRDPLGECYECARDGCSNKGTKSCIRCKLVRYCCKDCQVKDWKAGHKKACKQSAQTRSPSEGAIQAARSMASPALRSQDNFLRLNPQIDYRIVLPSGSQDVGVVFPHPMGKLHFKTLRSQAPESPYVYRIYEMLVESQPTRTNLIRKQLKAEYGVDPQTDEAKKCTNETMPTGQQMVDSLSSDMIFYPEAPLKPGETPSGVSVRGTVGHEVMFQIPHAIYEGRVQKLWNKNGQTLFGEHAPILLALLDAGIAQNSSETHRAESTTLCGNEEMLKSQLVRLKRQIKIGEESFLVVPLEPFYLNLPHAMIKTLLSIMIGNQSDLINKVMEGYTDVRVWTHKKGAHPVDESRPPDSNLFGPHPFTCGLRLQCGMTAVLATFLIHMILRSTKVPPSEVFVFPHALVFASLDGNQKLEWIKARLLLHSSLLFTDEGSVNSWCTLGKECTGPTPENPVGQEEFIEMVQKGCSWYPLFSDKASSRIQ